MAIYLVRHGEAKNKKEDLSMSLSEKGISDSEKISKQVSRILALQGLSINRIFHSGKLRAKQTAEILAKHIMPSL
jgi:phosphohistidine phosphatase